MYKLILLLISVIFLHACSTPQRQGEPAPVITRDGYVGQEASSIPVQPAPRRDGQVTVTPLQKPQSINAAPAPNRAVSLLQQRAREQMQANDFSGAAKSLERALGIAPQNAASWNLLAHLRARQGNHALAVDIATKSLSLLEEHETLLKKDNLLLLASLYRKLGEDARAEQFTQQAMAIK